MSRIVIKPIGIPDEYYPVAQIYTDGEGKFAFYVTDDLTNFLSQHRPNKRMAFARELCNKLILHMVSVAAKIAAERNCNNN